MLQLLCMLRMFTCYTAILMLMMMNQLVLKALLSLLAAASGVKRLVFVLKSGLRSQRASDPTMVLLQIYCQSITKYRNGLF
jgi:hypothetical protein